MMYTMNLVRAVILGTAALLAACSTPQRPSKSDAATTFTPQETHDATAAQWRTTLAAISAHADSKERRRVIEKRLAMADIRVTTMPFQSKELRGSNLLADVAGPTAAPLLLLGAHLDQVSKGHGVTDNASGCAVVLALAQRFQQRPLAHHRIAVAFWDLEEKGLLGARAYVAEKRTKPALYVNFDVFGWGDAVWMMSKDANDPLVAATQRATDAVGIRLSAGEQYPPTDHLAFQEAGWPAVSYSLVGHDEIAPILQVFAQQKPAQMPKVMQVIHSDADTMDQIDAAAVARGIDAIEAALRDWDGKPAR